MTDADQRMGSRCHRPLSTRILERLWWRGHPLFLYGLGLISFGLFHGHEYIGPFDSDSICRNFAFVDAMSWIMPKLTLDCDLITTTLIQHPKRDVAIVLDLIILFSFLCSIPIGIASHLKDIQAYRHSMVDGWRWNSLAGRCFLVVYWLIGNIFFFWMTFFLSILVTDSSVLFYWIGTLSVFGIGAIFQTIGPGLSALFLCAAVLRVFTESNIDEDR